MATYTTSIGQDIEIDWYGNDGRKVRVQYHINSKFSHPSFEMLNYIGTQFVGKRVRLDPAGFYFPDNVYRIKYI